MRRRMHTSRARAVRYMVVVPEVCQSRCYNLLVNALRDGTLFDFGSGARGFFWWSGKPGLKMRAIRDVIGGRRVA